MTVDEKGTKKGGLLEALFNVGAHLGYSKARRHASMKSFILGVKGKTDIINLDETTRMLEEALEFTRSQGAHQKTVLFVGGKPEIREFVRSSAETLDQPYVAGRWLGGTLTNFSEIKKRIQRLQELTQDREAGTLARKYTKRERVMIDREIGRLEENFSGLLGLEKLPDALVVVDTRAEEIAVSEAKQLGIPVVGILNSDCDHAQVTHPIVANDASRESVRFFLDKIVEAYREGVSGASKKEKE